MCPDHVGFEPKFETKVPPTVLLRFIRLSVIRVFIVRIRRMDVWEVVMYDEFKAQWPILGP